MSDYMSDEIEFGGIPLKQVKRKDGVWYHRGLDAEELYKWYVKKMETLKGIIFDK